LLADRGWQVLVLEAAPEPGGAVRSGVVTEPGFTSDLFSAFYPFAAVSPALHQLRLDRWGLRWTRSPLAVAHPLPDGRLGAVAATPRGTAAILSDGSVGDGDAWLDFMARWDRAG